MAHTLQRFNSKLSTSDAVRYVVAAAESQEGSAVFMGKGKVTRRKMKQTANSLPDGWNAHVIGYESEDDVIGYESEDDVGLGISSELIASYGSFLSVYRDGIDPHMVASWGNTS